MVHYCKIQGKNNKISAVNVTLLKPSTRDRDELSEYLGVVEEKITEGDANITQIVGSPLVWKHISEVKKIRVFNEEIFYEANEPFLPDSKVLI